jgi:uncharacterized protein (DUF849 family)
MDVTENYSRIAAKDSSSSIPHTAEEIARDLSRLDTPAW